jgi:hypothetical protein
VIGFEAARLWLSERGASVATAGDIMQRVRALGENPTSVVAFGAEGEVAHCLPDAGFAHK